MIVAQRLRKGVVRRRPRGAKRLVADALKTVAGYWPAVRGRSAGADGLGVLRPGAIGAAIRTGGAHVSVTVRLDRQVKAAIAASPTTRGPPSSTPTRSSTSEHQRWISRAEVAEIAFTAFAGRRRPTQVPGRLVVRRIPDLNPTRQAPGRTPCSTCWRFHAFFTTTDRRPARHRRRGQDPPRPRDHRAGPRRPEELRAGAPALREVHRQRRLAGPRGHRVQPHPRRRHPHRQPRLAKATTATIRRKLIARPRPGRAPPPAGSPCTYPQPGPGRHAWTDLFDRVADPPAAGHRLTTQPRPARPGTRVEHADSEVGPSPTPPPTPQRPPT